VIELTPERYATLVVIEDKYYRLCEIIKERGWRGLSAEELRFIQAMLGIEEEEKSE
jgi:hypothetical protein